MLSVIIGPQSSGKTTVAEFLINVHNFTPLFLSDLGSATSKGVQTNGLAKDRPSSGLNGKVQDGRSSTHSNSHQSNLTASTVRRLERHLSNSLEEARDVARIAYEICSGQNAGRIVDVVPEVRPDRCSATEIQNGRDSGVAASTDPLQGWCDWRHSHWRSWKECQRETVMNPGPESQPADFIPFAKRIPSDDNEHEKSMSSEKTTSAEYKSLTFTEIEELVDYVTAHWRCDFVLILRSKSKTLSGNKGGTHNGKSLDELLDGDDEQSQTWEDDSYKYWNALGKRPFSILISVDSPPLTRFNRTLSKRLLSKDWFAELLAAHLDVVASINDTVSGSKSSSEDVLYSKMKTLSDLVACHEKELKNWTSFNKFTAVDQIDLYGLAYSGNTGSRSRSVTATNNTSKGNGVTVESSSDLNDVTKELINITDSSISKEISKVQRRQNQSSLMRYMHECANIHIINSLDYHNQTHLNHDLIKMITSYMRQLLKIADLIKEGGDASVIKSWAQKLISENGTLESKMNGVKLSDRKNVSYSIAKDVETIISSSSINSNVSFYHESTKIHYINDSNIHNNQSGSSRNSVGGSGGREDSSLLLDVTRDMTAEFTWEAEPVHGTSSRVKGHTHSSSHPTARRSPMNEFIYRLSRMNITEEERLRPNWDRYFMLLADIASQRSNCMKRRVGCVLVNNKRIIATGYNGTPRNVRNCNEGGCLRCNDVGKSKCGSNLDLCLCLHAEENALLEAGRKLVEKEGESILYCNTCPCLGCAKKIVQVGVKEVVYSQEYRTDDLTSKLFKEAGVLLRQLETIPVSFC